MYIDSFCILINVNGSMKFGTNGIWLNPFIHSDYSCCNVWSFHAFSGNELSLIDYFQWALQLDRCFAELLIDVNNE